MINKHFTIATISSLALLAAVHAEDPLPPTPPGGSTAPATKPNTSSTTSPSQQLGLKGRKGGEGNRLEKLKEELGLTPQQMKEMRPIFEKAHSGAKALRASSLAPDEKKRKMREIFVSTIQQIKPQLTLPQLAKLKELRKEHSTATAST